MVTKWPKMSATYGYIPISRKTLRSLRPEIGEFAGRAGQGMVRQGRKGQGRVRQGRKGQGRGTDQKLAEQT